MRQEHTLAIPQGVREYRPFRIALIGCGGNGSAVLFGLPYLHQAMLAWGFARGLEVTVLDPDTVSETNCVRQPFGRGDIGQNKAEVLVNRVNLFHGLNWTAVPAAFTKETNPCRSYRPFAVDFVISCVDTRKARRKIHRELFDRNSPWGETRYWLDLGNGAASGQFVLGQPLNRANRKKRDRLRTVSELYPGIMDADNGEEDLPSCSAAEALERQEPFINNVLATSALSMLTRLVRYGKLSYHGGFYNAQTGLVAPLAIDPEAWARRRKTPGVKRSSSVRRNAQQDSTSAA